MDEMEVEIKYDRYNNGSEYRWMIFVGLTELFDFLRDHPDQGEPLRAWLAEIQHRNWTNRQALAADFQSLDSDNPPLAVFRFGRPEVVIETLIDFQNQVVLLTGIRMNKDSGPHVTD
jgi:mRNA-degrading endonuclease HigB of HigAB toxin-antitoxin module